MEYSHGTHPADAQYLMLLRSRLEQPVPAGLFPFWLREAVALEETGNESGQQSPGSTSGTNKPLFCQPRFCQYEGRIDCAA